MHLSMQVVAAAVLLAAIVASCAAGSNRPLAAKLLANSSISAIREGIRNRQFTCEDIITEQLKRIDAYNSTLKLFISVNRENAIALARIKDQSILLSGSLHCVPVAVKDNIDVQGIPTTSGARALQSMSAAQDSAVVARIKAMGGIIIGKTNMAEMSDSGIKSVSTLGGVCSNPWDTRRSCLGSSGGSAAAVASGLAVIGIGTDTEGSVIGPCLASGLLCMRPTQGQGAFEDMKVGVYPAFDRQDLVGIMAKSRADYLTAHDAIYGTLFTTTVGSITTLTGLKIRFLDNFYDVMPLPVGTYSPDSEMVRLHNITAQRLSALGAEVERYRTNMADLGGKFNVIFSATSTKPNCSNSCMKKSLDTYLSRYSSTGPFRNARDLLTVASGFPSSYVEKLNFTVNQADADVCAGLCAAYNASRSSITAILTDLMGNASALAMPFSAKLPQLNTEDVSVVDQITPALNPYTGWPSISLPVGFSTSSGSDQPQGMPVSVILMAKEGQEAQLLTIANAFLNAYADIRTPSSTPEVKGAGSIARENSVLGLVFAWCIVLSGRMLSV